MLLVHLALLHAVACLDIQVEGDLAFDLRLPNEDRGRQKWFRVGWEAGSQAKELVFKMMQVRRNVTVAPEMECIYQYPEKEQVNALLSNMMNELTKVFVRANDFINGLETRRNGLTSRESDASSKGDHKGKEAKKDANKESKKDTKKEGKKDMKKEGKAAGAVPRRGEDSRFRVVNKKQKAFFELIYSNMTNEYRNFYNTTAERVDRSGRDPCQHQDEVKQIWRDLLEHALSTLRGAAQRCVAEHLRERRVQPQARVRARLAQYLARELGKVRAAQLHMLCDTYQLCYNDLLK